jgi:hypothetical protein
MMVYSSEILVALDLKSSMSVTHHLAGCLDTPKFVGVLLDFALKILKNLEGLFAKR